MRLANEWLSLFVPGKTFNVHFYSQASSEKKQDRKAAKTLSAILLAFIITWTPYSVLVIINAFLGKYDVAEASKIAQNYVKSKVVSSSIEGLLCYVNR